MALPTNECFRGLDLLDQLAAIYEALYDLAADASLTDPACFKWLDRRDQITAIYAALAAISETEGLPTVECFRTLDISDQLLAIYEAALNIGSGPEPPFSPDQLTDLSAWWKEDGIQVSGSDVTGWLDSSGNGRNLNPLGAFPQLNAGSLNGFDVIDFSSPDGTIGTPLNHGNDLLGGIAATTFIVAFKSSFWNEAGIYTARTNFQANHHPFSDNAVYDANFSTARKSCGAQVVAIADNWRIFSIRSGPADYRMEIDGIAQFSTVTNTYSQGQDFLLGAGAFDGATDTAYAMQGSIAEVIVYNRFLSDVERDQVINYLRTRFALP